MGVGLHFLLQGIFLTQESSPGLPCLLPWRVWSPAGPGPLSDSMLFLPGGGVLRDSCRHPPGPTSLLFVSPQVSRTVSQVRVLAAGFSPNTVNIWPHSLPAWLLGRSQA